MTKFRLMLASVLAIFMFGLLTVPAHAVEAQTAPSVSQAQAKKGCWNGSACRRLFHSPQYVTPNVIDKAFQVKCEGPTVYWVFETETTGNSCPGITTVTAVKSAVLDVNSGRYIRCWNGSTWTNFGHLDGSWHNLPIAPYIGDCHRVDAFNNPA